MAGATVAIWTLAAVCVDVPLVTMICAVPGATVEGTRNVIASDEVGAENVAGVVTPAASKIETVGAGEVANCPAAMAMEPGAMAVALGLVADRINGTFAAGVEPATGATDTPRNTSPALAVRRIVNFRRGRGGAGIGHDIRNRHEPGSGLQPESPFVLLMVPVMAQMVTVPSPFTLPVILRRPSVAGLRWDVG